MKNYKNLRLEPAEGGFILTYDVYEKSKDTYDGMKYVCDKKEVFEDPREAMEKLMELHTMAYSPDQEKEYPSKRTMRGDETPNLSSEGMESALGGG